MSYLPLRSSHQPTGSFATSESSDSSTPSHSTTDTTATTTTSSSVPYPLATTTTTPTSAAGAGGNGVTYTSSTARSHNAPAIITSTTFTCTTTITTANSQTSSCIELGETAAEGNTSIETESSTSLEDEDYVQVMAVPDAAQCSEDLPEESETMRLTQEPAVSVQKVDRPSLIGTNDSIIATAAQMTSVLSGMRESGDASVTPAESVESLNSQAVDSTELLDSGSPRKQPRRVAAAKRGGRRTTARRQTANSKRKS